MSHSFRARTLVLGAAILLTLAGTGCDEIPEADPSADPATTVTTNEEIGRASCRERV